MYTLPATYEVFLDQLTEACQQGDADSKQAIQTLAPHMATTLKEHKQGEQWNNPDVPLDDVPPEIKIITSLSQVKPPELGFVGALIKKRAWPTHIQ